MVYKRIMKILPVLMACVLLFLAVPSTASADMGPKPSITVIVKNPPSGEYYMDLLRYYNDENNVVSNLKEYHQDQDNLYDQTKLSLLDNYNTDGWRSALVHGTRVPMFGKLTGTNENGQIKHTFSYIVPDEYKVILVTPDNRIAVSNKMKKETFRETVTLDYSTMNIPSDGSEGTFQVTKQSNIILDYLLQFLMTYLPTILIEGLILLLFRFSLKANWKPFLLVNFITQVIMTFLLGTTLLKSGLVSCYFAFFPIEIGIIVAEAIAYSILLKEHTVKRRVSYAITANLASAAAGFLMMPFEFNTFFG